MPAARLALKGAGWVAIHTFVPFNTNAVALLEEQGLETELLGNNRLIELLSAHPATGFLNFAATGHPC